jgi:hypothetical protein
MKLGTFVRQAGPALYRSGPGKPWKANESDSLSERMRILTPKGPVFEVVRGSRERYLLGSYERAIRHFRAAADNAVEELMAFKGQTVAGHELITDPNLLMQLEESDQLDFDSLYYPPGSSR